jgi:Phospholipase_D-nuclease N-terminal
VTPLAASTAVWVFILLPILVVWVIGIVDIVRRDVSRRTKAAWILVIVLLPVAGTIAYFALRKPSEAEIQRAQQASRDRGHDWSRQFRSRNPGG